MALTRKRFSIDKYYNYIVIPTVILLACLGVTIPFLVYEEHRLTSAQLMNSIRNVLSPSNGKAVLRSSAVPDLDSSIVAAVIGLVALVAAIVVAIVGAHLPVISPDSSLAAPSMILVVLLGIMGYTAWSYSTMSSNEWRIALAMIFVFMAIFGISVWQTDILYKNKDKNLIK